MILFDTVVTVVNYETTGTDRLGKPSRAVKRRIPGVAARLTQIDSNENPSFVTDRYRAILAPGTQLAPADRLEHKGRTFRVEGHPVDKCVPGFIGVSHVAVKLSLIAEA